MQKLFILIVLLFFGFCKSKENPSQAYESKQIKVKETIIKITVTNPIKEVDLFVYEPIDNISNFSYVTKNNIKKIYRDTTVIIRAQIEEPNTFTLQYGVARAILNMFPGDSVTVDLVTTNKGYKMNFSGTDSIFHTRYNNDSYFLFKNKTFDSIFIGKSIDPKTMINKVENYISKKNLFIDTLRLKEKITEEKCNYLKKIYRYSIAAMCPNPISTFYTNNKNLHLFDTLYQHIDPFDPISLKCFYGLRYISKYIYDVNAKRTEYFTGNYDTTWKEYGYYSNYGYAPTFIQHALWGEMLFILSENNSGEIDIKRAFNKFKTVFPKSSYNSILYSKIFAKSTTIFSGTFINKQYISLKELHSDKFKNKDLFIDLWATWCMPCLAEFKNKDEFTAYLKKNNIEMLYLSMDEKEDYNQWKKTVRNFKLNDYNEIVNERLKEDILQKIYESKEWSIPRYILINKKGEIVLKDAPRPSDPQLKILIEKYLTK